MERLDRDSPKTGIYKSLSDILWCLSTLAPPNWRMSDSIRNPEYRTDCGTVHKRLCHGEQAMMSGWNGVLSCWLRLERLSALRTFKLVLHVKTDMFEDRILLPSITGLMESVSAPPLEPSLPRYPRPEDDDSPTAPRTPFPTIYQSCDSRRLVAVCHFVAQSHGHHVIPTGRLPGRPDQPPACITTGTEQCERSMAIFLRATS
jgi:hypothetical protein